MSRPISALITALAAFIPSASLLAGPAPHRLTRVPARVLSPGELDRVPRDGSHLFLHAAVFDPLKEEPDFSGAGLDETPSTAKAIVQLRAGRLAARAELEALGVRVLGYVPDFAYIVSVPQAARAAVASHPDVRYFGPYRPGFRVSARLWHGGNGETTDVQLFLFRGESVDAVAAALRESFPELSPVQRDASPDAPRLTYVLTRPLRERFVKAVSEIDAVLWLEPRVPAEITNNDALAPVQSNAATVLAGAACTTCTLFGHGLTGTGQVGAIADTGNDSDMCYFTNLNGTVATTDASATTPPALGPLFPARKLRAYFVMPGADPYDTMGPCGGRFVYFHGTHTSGTLVGDNVASPSSPSAAGVDVGDGMAPNAQLVFQDVGDVNGCLNGLRDYYGMFLQANLAGARIHSNSYGSGTAGAYTGEDQTLDRFLFDHEEMAVFFAAGNSALTQTTYSPGNAKDAVTVGALNHGNDTTVAGFSSRGPTADGRIKPDIAAPGTNTVSAGGDATHGDANCTIFTLSGTSMATPTAAGASLLLRQYFDDGFYPSGSKTAADALHPSASLVKAVLVNGALPLPAGGTFGNGDYGWGRVFLDSNLYFAGDARKLRVVSLANPDGLTTGQNHTFTVNVGAGQELRVSLVWADAEATLGMATTLVNDLDLVVTGPSGTYRGNALDGTGNSIAGAAAIDVKNNVEQVRLATPAAGMYTITVMGKAIPGNGRFGTDRQGYALVASFASCATAVAAAPTGLSVVSNPVMGADVTFTPAANATATQIYRAPGTCGAPAGDFQYVGSTAGSTFTDSRAEGGYSYAYRLRGADACGEGPASTCVSITPSGRCDLPPLFAGLASALPDGTNCRVLLTWAPATSRCPASSGVRYDVYRSTTPGFAPSPATLHGSVENATTFLDASTANGTTYYYVVRAEDLTTASAGPNGGNQETNGIQLYATPTGPPGGMGTYLDDGGDTAAHFSSEPPWQVTATDAQAGTHSYHFGPDGGTYSPNTCASLTTPDIRLGNGSVLTYWIRYNVEYQWDGLVVEISNDLGATWNDLVPTNPAGYPSTLALTQNPPINACNYQATHGAFTGPTGNAALTPWTQIDTDLSAYKNDTVMIRWRFTSDPGVEYQGVFLDSISVTNAHLPGACTTIPNPTPSLTTLVPSSRAAGSPGFLLELDGLNFTNESFATWNGAPLATTWASATQLVAFVPASDVASPGAALVSVTTPTPGGGVSPALAFCIDGAAPFVIPPSALTVTQTLCTP